MACCQKPCGPTAWRQSGNQLGLGFLERRFGRRARSSFTPLLTFYRIGLSFPTDHLQERPLAQDQTNLLQGTLDMMILKSLALAEMHGLGISRRIEQITRGTFQVKPGSLFPALHRMEEEGWLVSYWGESENNRRAKYYKLTVAGRRQLDAERKRWGRIALAITRTLETS